jgi:hypothetical protein
MTTNTNIIDKLETMLRDDFGIVQGLTPAQKAQAVAKFGGNVSAASSEKVVLAEAIEAAAASDQAHVREVAKFATGLARRNLISLDTDELGLNKQLAASKMGVADKMALKNLLFKLGAIEA